jgi:phenylpropionate dioxygenase-like ring-hydroxylating dioxygenase large terminal subunit
VVVTGATLVDPATAPGPVRAPEARLDLGAFWYVAAESGRLRPGRVVAGAILGEAFALFRDDTGRAAALEDRCAHRAAPLSRGRLDGGRLRCTYHGWLYDARGAVAEIPGLRPAGAAPAPTGHAAGAALPGPPPCRPAGVRAFPVAERDGYVYVCPSGRPAEPTPRPIPHLGEPGWGHVRLVNRFAAAVTECVENFVNVPHTAWVHPALFRSRRDEPLRAVAARRGGSVTVQYRGERRNLGIAGRFLNRAGREIGHRDAFHMPNVTCVEYEFGPRRRFVITSQAVPVGDDATLVYTDLTFDYGIWTRLAREPVRWLARRIIDQDRAVLAAQAAVIRRTGPRFSHTPADVVHVWIERIRRELAEGRDPSRLPAETREIALWV